MGVRLSWYRNRQHRNEFDAACGGVLIREHGGVCDVRGGGSGDVLNDDGVQQQG